MTITGIAFRKNQVKSIESARRLRIMSQTRPMKQLTPTSIRLGITLLLLAAASCALIFSIHNKRINAEQATVAAP
jgi:hypothetical protein